jgi:DNA-binding CsgD family transcriptional regulator
MGEVPADAPGVAGVALHIAAQVMEQAGPDEILVSGPAHDLLPGANADLAPIGTVNLRGLPEPWPLFRVVTADASPDRRPGAISAAQVQPAAALSRRERELARLLAYGLSNRQIADELVISVGTVERHVANILMKLGFRSRAQIAAWSVDHGLLEPTSALDPSG